MIDVTRPKIIDATITETPDVKHVAMDELQEGLASIRQSPKEEGILHLIVRRPEFDRREILGEGQLDLLEGLVGDAWRSDANLKEDGSLDLDDQLTLMNTRVIGLISPDKSVGRWRGINCMLRWI